MRFRLWIVIFATWANASFSTAQPTLLSRDQLGGPERSSGAISPNGDWLAYVADVDGVPNLFLCARTSPEHAAAITHDTGRGVRNFWFAYDNRHLLFTQDQAGDENDRVFALNLRTNAVRPLTPAGSRAVIDTLSPQAPGSVLVMMNDRDQRFFDPVRIDIATGRMHRLFENSEYAAFVADQRLRLRLATRYSDDGSKHWHRRRGETWEPWMDTGAEDALTTSIVGFTADNRTLLMVDSRNRDRSAMVALDFETGARHEIATDPVVDLGTALAHPQTGAVEAVLRNDLARTWLVVDPAIREDMATLARIAGDAPFEVVSRSLDNRAWIVRVAPTDASARTYIYERRTRRASLWYEENPSWAELELQPMHAVAFESRDGLRLTAYYLLPPGSDSNLDGVPDTPAPTILWVHGGPWDRESSGMNPLFQLYASRGYAVLSVNYRGSTGFGKAFVNAADGQWGAAMQSDLLDAKNWAVNVGIAIPDRIAVVGGSYGGYAALAAMAFTPGEFACGISVSGPANLLTLMSTIPEYWTATRTLYENRVGNPGTIDGRALLERRSPLNAAAHIRGALLIGQGANDPRVTRAEAEQMVHAMRANNAPVTYVLFPDEGHGFQRRENDTAFSAVTEEFLATCLGGRYEPVGADFEGSSITIPVGVERLPGVAAALQRHAP